MRHPLRSSFRPVAIALFAFLITAAESFAMEKSSLPALQENLPQADDGSVDPGAGSLLKPFIGFSSYLSPPRKTKPQDASGNSLLLMSAESRNQKCGVYLIHDAPRSISGHFEFEKVDLDGKLLPQSTIEQRLESTVARINYLRSYGFFNRVHRYVGRVCGKEGSPRLARDRFREHRRKIEGGRTRLYQGMREHCSQNRNCKMTVLVKNANRKQVNWIEWYLIENFYSRVGKYGWNTVAGSEKTPLAAAFDSVATEDSGGADRTNE